MQYAILAGFALLALAACVQEETRLDTGDSDAAAACEAVGGTYELAGLSPVPICMSPTEDAGKACSFESDCTGFCLADTRTCSTVSPLFGCHAILMDDGERAEICID